MPIVALPPPVTTSVLLPLPPLIVTLPIVTFVTLYVSLPVPPFTVSPAPSVTVSLPGPRLITSVLLAPMMVMPPAASGVTLTVAFRLLRSVTVAPCPSCAVMNCMFVSFVSAARLNAPPPDSTNVLTTPAPVPPVMLSPGSRVAAVATMVVLTGPVLIVTGVVGRVTVEPVPVVATKVRSVPPPPVLSAARPKLFCTTRTV